MKISEPGLQDEGCNAPRNGAECSEAPIALHAKLAAMDLPVPAAARSSAHPRPWAHCPEALRRAVRGVFTDIDDTLTRDGAIEPAALAALHALAEADVPVIAITGRPLGWSEPFATAWPVAAIVAENGAVALLPQPGGGVLTEFAQDAATRAKFEALKPKKKA